MSFRELPPMRPPAPALARTPQPSDGFSSFFEDGFLPRGAGLFARAAGFFGAGDLLRVLTRRWVVPLGVPSPEARLARVATMVVAAKPHLRV